jgi:hypothetical protein
VVVTLSLAVTLSVVFNSYFTVVLSTRVVVSFSLSVTVSFVDIGGIISTRMVVTFSLAVTASLLVGGLETNFQLVKAQESMAVPTSTASSARGW